MPEQQTYDAVVIGAESVRDVDALTRPFGRTRVVVSAEPVWRRHGSHLRRLAGRGGPILVPDGERAKALGTVARLYDAFLDRGLDRAATVLIILVLGGYGRLYGAFIGAVAYMVLAHFLSKIYPTAWQLGLGLTLMLVALYARNGVLGLAGALRRRWSAR